MQRSNAGDSDRTIQVGAADFQCQVGGLISLARSSDMDTHPPLPELTGTKDQQCQAFTVTSDFQCQAKKSTTDIECQAKVSAEIISSYREQRPEFSELPVIVLPSEPDTTCSASQCDLQKQIQVTDSHSQTETCCTAHTVITARMNLGTGTGNPKPSTDACSRRHFNVTSDQRMESRQITANSSTISSDVQSQTDRSSSQLQSLEMDEQGIQVTPCSADVFSQTDSTGTACGGYKGGEVVLRMECSENPATSTSMYSQTESVETEEKTTRQILDGQPGQQLCMQAWRSLDVQCQVWPDARDAECQVDTRRVLDHAGV